MAPLATLPLAPCPRVSYQPGPEEQSDAQKLGRRCASLGGTTRYSGVQGAETALSLGVSKGFEDTICMGYLGSEWDLASK